MFLNLQHIAPALAAQAGPAPGPGGCAENNALLLPVIMIVILYFVWILPMRKERKTHQTMLETLKRGDEVITTSGLIGTVADMTDRVITLEVAKNVKIRMLKTAIAKRAEEPKPAAAKGDEKGEKGDASKSSTSKESKPSKT